jgi:hypothetical protein
MPRSFLLLPLSKVMTRVMNVSVCDRNLDSAQAAILIDRWKYLK